MHITLNCEFYDENGDWFDLGTPIIERETYLGDLEPRVVNYLVDYLMRPESFEEEAKTYREYDIELLAIHSYSEMRKNVAIVYMQFMINTK